MIGQSDRAVSGNRLLIQTERTQYRVEGPVEVPPATARERHFLAGKASDHIAGKASCSCMHQGGLDPDKLSFLIDTGCTHNLLSKQTFNKLLVAMNEKLELWDTSSILTDSCGLPVCEGGPSGAHPKLASSIEF